MDLQTRKIEFIQEFLRLESADAVAKLEKKLNNLSTRLISAGIEPMTMDELNTRIDKSEYDFKNGRFISAEDL